MDPQCEETLEQTKKRKSAYQPTITSDAKKFSMLKRYYDSDERQEKLKQRIETYLKQRNDIDEKIKDLMRFVKSSTD